MPVLIALRHAKADSPLGTPDVDRPLSARGRRDARAAGAELRATGRLPERIICSTALRARQTLAELNLDSPVVLEPRLYEADEEDLLDLLREQADDPAGGRPGSAGRGNTVLLLIGHNPGLLRLVLAVADASAGGFTPAEPGLPPGAAAVVTFDGAWSGLAHGVGRLVSVWTPRG